MANDLKALGVEPPLKDIEIHDGEVFVVVAPEWDEDMLDRIRLGPVDAVFTMFADKMAQEDFGER
jgi:hypothetical protein